MKRFLALLFCFVGLVHADLSLSTEDRSLANLNIEVSKDEYHLFDYFIWEPSISRPEKMKLFVKSEALSFRLVKDRKSYQFSMTEPIYAFVAFAGSLAYNQHYGYAPFYVITYLFNPSVELFPWPEHVPLSLSLGYHFDFFWFCKHPSFYFEPHFDLSAEFKLGLDFRISASVGFLVSDVYDLKRGARFHVGLGI